MALTCSVLGHAYGDPTVERDREERGSEVVVTVREYETCTRCGTTRVVSENKEVTAVEAGDDVEPVTDRTTDLDPRVADVAPDLADETIADASSGESRVAPETDAGDVEDDVTDEGAEILDAEASAPVEDAVDEELASPTVAEPEDADESTTEEDDGVVLDDSSDERAPGEWPAEDESNVGEDWSPPSEPAESSSSPEPALGPTITVPEGEFHCEECGYSTPVESSSLRAGDFCPSCRRGSLTHVVESE